MLVAWSFVVFFLLYGISFGNQASQAAPWRGFLAACVVFFLILWLWRSKTRLEAPHAIMAGILGALVIGEAASGPALGRSGFSPWLIFSTAWWAQSQVKRPSDRWRDDWAWAGVILSLFVAWNVFSGEGATLGGTVNRNALAHTIALLVPAMIARWGWPGAAIAAPAVIWTGSRGGLVALVIVAVLMFQFPRRVLAYATPAAAAGLIGLALVRPATLGVRLEIMRQAIMQWFATSPLFGVGPGGVRMELGGLGVGHAHNTFLTVAAQGGLVGVLVIIVTILLLAHWRRPGWTRWQWAMLAVAAILSLFEDVATAWGFLLALGLSLGHTGVSEG